MRLIEGIVYAAMVGSPLENAQSLVKLDRLRSALAHDKKMKRKPITEPKNRVGARDPRSTATDEEGDD